MSGQASAPDPAPPGDDDQDHENAPGPVDHPELDELLTELRVLLPGVQVLFAFLLTVPFTPRFTDLTDMQQRVYAVAFLSTALGSILLMAPGAYHRIAWREVNRQRLLTVANRLAVIGTVCVAVAIVAVVAVVTNLIYPGLAGWFTGGTAAAVFLLWFVIPLLDRVRAFAGDGRRVPERD